MTFATIYSDIVWLQAFMKALRAIVKRYKTSRTFIYRGTVIGASDIHVFSWKYTINFKKDICYNIESETFLRDKKFWKINENYKPPSIIPYPIFNTRRIQSIPLISIFDLHT